MGKNLIFVKIKIDKDEEDKYYYFAVGLNIYWF